MQIEIPKQVAWMLEQLRSHGFEAFVVGGCIRDTLLGKEPEDWDITTSAKPVQVKAVFGRTIDTGLQHGTVTVLRGGIGYEITTYRIDGEYEDGRHPSEVAFTSDLKEDLRRRDFTINAMAYSPQTGIVDVFGGISDLERGMIRCVGDAGERFTEDALRILRAIRFSAQLGFTIEEETYKALSVIAPNLIHVSKERIQVELAKTLLSDHPEKVLLVEKTGMAPYIAPSFPRVFTCGSKDKLILAGKLPKDRALRFAALLYAMGEEAAVTLLRELKMDNDTKDRVKVLAAWSLKDLPEDASGIRRVMSTMSDGLFDDLIEYKKILFPDTYLKAEQAEKTARSIRENGDCIRLKDLAVSGNDLIKAGVQPGPQLGKLLHDLFELVLETPECNNREYLLSAALKR